ncbi:MAG: two component transcriptional regulator, winged helix family [Chitinophagaceae bacterium]|nr:two component transcriptional regulator, winged helix family [Chitinophagaceae bacterium]
MGERILLIEDERKLSLIIKETFALYNFDVMVAEDGAEGLNYFTELNPSLVILDIMMPRMDGFEVLGHLRKLDKNVPVIMLTAKSQTVDLVKGFDLGCNDYIKKPFIMDELLVRVRSLLERKNESGKNENHSAIITLGKCIFHIHAQELRTPSQVYKLSFKETEILKRLCANTNRVLDRRTMLLELWGDDNIFNSKNLNVYITKLRNLLKEEPDVEIINIRSIGYKLVNRNMK